MTDYPAPTVPHPRTGPTSSPELAEYLRQLHLEAGAPTRRAIAKAINYSHTTVTDHLRGRTGNWVVIEGMVRFFGVDPEKAHRLWVKANTNRNARGLKPPPPPPWVDPIVAELRAIRAVLEEIAGIRHAVVEEGDDSAAHGA